MTSTEKSPISLEQAKHLVALLEADDHQGANELIGSAISNPEELFSEVGKLTRQLHDSLNSFQLDQRISNLAKDDIPDAQSRLAFVIETTEKAANQTMDAVEASMPLAEKLNERIDTLLPEWKKLMSRQLELGEFKSLCYGLDKLLEEAAEDSAKLNSQLTEILMAQGFQDITGQVIRRVIELVKEVEDSLVHMLTVFGQTEAGDSQSPRSESNTNVHEKAEQTDKVKAEGPIIDAESREDVVSGQNDVDDLLSSLGF